ncbi:MAG: hypothetical protein AB7V42_01760 [Thermoleophilia bacterium]
MIATLASLPGLLAAQAGTDTSSDDPFESISSFFDSTLWSALRLMLQIFVVLLWLALVYWTYQDARRRIAAPGAIAGCVALSVLLPFLGSIIYLIVRPPEYLDEARERELELLALEQRLGELGDQEGQEIVSRMLAREGLANKGDAQGVQRALKQAGVASVDDLRDLDLRLTELEFRLKLNDRGGLPASREDQEREARHEARQQQLTDTAGGETAGETGRAARWRRTRRDQDAYD